MFSHVYWPVLYALFAHFSIGLFLLNCKSSLYMKDPGSLLLVLYPSLIPVFLFLFILFMVYFHFLGFTAFLERSSHLAGSTPDSGTCSLLVAKSPVLASFLQAQHPCSPKLCAFVRLTCRVGLETHWGRLIQTAGGERKLPAFSNWSSFSFWSFISSSLFACALLSLSLSLCRFLLFASCLPHPKSCAKPYTSWTYRLHNHLWGRYYYNPHLTDEETEVEGGS